MTPTSLAGEDYVNKVKSSCGVSSMMFLPGALPVHFWGERVTIWGLDTV